MRMDLHDMMSGNGLVKLMEECGELVQIAAKKLAYYDTDIHPDGKGSLRTRMTEEMGDVLAAIDFVTRKFEISEGALDARRKMKLELFSEWDNLDSNIVDSYDFNNVNLKKALRNVQFERDNIKNMCEVNAQLRKRIKELESGE